MTRVLFHILWPLVKFYIRLIRLCMERMPAFLQPSIGFMGEMLSGNSQGQDLMETLSMACTTFWRTGVLRTGSQSEEQPRKRRRLCFPLSYNYYYPSEDEPTRPVVKCKRRPCRGSHVQPEAPTPEVDEITSCDVVYGQAMSCLKQAQSALERGMGKECFHSVESLSGITGNAGRQQELGTQAEQVTPDLMTFDDEDEELENKENIPPTLDVFPKKRPSRLATRHPLLISLLQKESPDPQENMSGDLQDTQDDANVASSSNSTHSKPRPSKFATRYPVLVGLLQGTIKDANDVINMTNEKKESNHDASVSDDSGSSYYASAHGDSTLSSNTTIFQDKTLSSDTSSYNAITIISQEDSDEIQREVTDKGTETEATAKAPLLAGILKQVYQVPQSQSIGELGSHVTTAMDVEHVQYIRESLASKGLSQDCSTNASLELTHQDETLPFPDDESVFQHEQLGTPKISSDSSFVPADVTTDLSSVSDHSELSEDTKSEEVSTALTEDTPKSDSKEADLPWYASMLMRASYVTTDFIENLAQPGRSKKKARKVTQTACKLEDSGASEASSGMSDSWSSASDQMENFDTRGQNLPNKSLTPEETKNVEITMDKSSSVSKKTNTKSEEEGVLFNCDLQGNLFDLDSSSSSDPEVPSLQWPDPPEEDICSSGQFEGNDDDEDFTNVSVLSSFTEDSHVLSSPPPTDSGLDDLSTDDRITSMGSIHVSLSKQGDKSESASFPARTAMSTSLDNKGPLVNLSSSDNVGISSEPPIVGNPPSSQKEDNLLLETGNGSTVSEIELKRNFSSSAGKLEWSSPDKKATFASLFTPSIQKEEDSDISGDVSPLFAFDVKRDCSASSEPESSSSSGKSSFASVSQSSNSGYDISDLLGGEDQEDSLAPTEVLFIPEIKSLTIGLKSAAPEDDGKLSAPPSGQIDATGHSHTQVESALATPNRPDLLLSPPRDQSVHYRTPTKKSYQSTPVHVLMSNLNRLQEHPLSSSNSRIMDVTARVVRTGLALARQTLADHLPTLDLAENPSTDTATAANTDVSPPMWPETCIRDIFEVASHSSSTGSEVEDDEASLPEAPFGDVTTPICPENSFADASLSGSSWDVLSLADVSELSNGQSTTNPSTDTKDSPFSVISDCESSGSEQQETSGSGKEPTPDVAPGSPSPREDLPQTPMVDEKEFRCHTPASVKYQSEQSAGSTPFSLKGPLSVFTKSQSVGCSSPFTEICIPGKPKPGFIHRMKELSMPAHVSEPELNPTPSEDVESNKSSQEESAPEGSTSKEIQHTELTSMKDCPLSTDLIGLTLNDQSVGDNSPFVEICYQGTDMMSEDATPMRQEKAAKLARQKLRDAESLLGVKSLVKKPDGSVLKELLNVYLYGGEKGPMVPGVDEGTVPSISPFLNITPKKKWNKQKSGGYCITSYNVSDDVPHHLSPRKNKGKQLKLPRSLPGSPSKGLSHRDIVELCSPKKVQKPHGDEEEEEDWLYSPSVRRETPVRRLSAGSIENVAAVEDMDLGVSVLPEIEPEDVGEPISQIVSEHLWGASGSGVEKGEPIPEEQDKEDAGKDNEGKEKADCECKLCLGIEKIKKTAAEIMHEGKAVPTIVLDPSPCDTPRPLVCGGSGAKPKRRNTWDLNMSPIACMPDAASLPLMQCDSYRAILQFTQNSTAPELPILDPLHDELDRSLQRHQSCPSLRSLGCQASLNSLPWENCSLDSEVDPSELPFCSTLRDSVIPPVDLAEVFINASHAEQLVEPLPSEAGLTSPGKTVPAMLNTTLNRRKRKYSFLKRFAPWFSGAPKSPLKVIADAPQESHLQVSPYSVAPSTEEPSVEMATPEDKWYNKLFKSRKNKSTLKKQSRKLSFIDSRQSQSLTIEPHEPVYVVGAPMELPVL